MPIIYEVFGCLPDGGDGYDNASPEWPKEFFMYLFAKKPSLSAAPSRAPAPATQHAAKTPPVTPLWLRSAMSTVASTGLTEERRRSFTEPALTPSQDAPSSPIKDARGGTDVEAEAAPAISAGSDSASAPRPVMPPSVQRMAATSSADAQRSGHNFPSTSQRVQQGLGAAARPLDATDRERFEERFAWSFADVRVHDGPEAEKAATGLGARAFTVGRDIVMGEADGAERREELLAHELAHVVQTGGAAPAGAVDLADPHQTAEREARDAATRVVAGGSAGALTPAKPHIHRAPITMPQVKKQIIAKGRDDISELAKALPNSFGGGAVKVREATVGTTKHVFELAFSVVQGSPGVFASSKAITGEGVKTTGTGMSQKTTHTLVIRMFSTVSDPVETLFHELIHARILMDSSLPEGERGETYRRYAQLMELSTGPMAIVTGTEPKRQAVLQAIARMRAAAKLVPGFDEKQLDSQYDAPSIYEFLINEKFTNQDAAAAFGTSISNATVASRYASAVRGLFEKAIQGQGLWSEYTAAPGGGTSRLKDFMVEAEDMLRKALVELYQSLDDQKKKIDDLKKTTATPAGPAGPDDMLIKPNFLPGAGITPAPLDLEGKPVGTPP